jgi:hypothetical protein
MARAREKGPEASDVETVSEEEALRRRIEQSKYEH